MGVGRCLRNDAGTWITGFSQINGEGNALEAKLWAIMIRLKLLSQMSPHSRVIVASDSSTAIDIIVHAIPDHHPMETIINNCRYLFSELEDYMFVKGSIHQNGCANLLAKEG